MTFTALGRFSCFWVLGLVPIPLGCNNDENAAGSKVYSATFGVFDDDESLRETRQIPFEIGCEYGWELHVASSSGKVRVREVFELPGPAKWSVAGESIAISTTSANGRIHQNEFIVDNTKSGGVRQIYEMIEGDPQGTHVITLYLDDVLTERFEFTIGEVDR